MQPPRKPLMDQVRSSLRHWLPAGGRLLVAVSGGRDSMVLLEALHRLARGLRLRLTVAHVHHGIRGTEADQDQAFVVREASRRHIPCVTSRVRTTAYRTRHRMGLEEAARHLRYRALERLRRRAKADVIVTAHHADDQAETVFLRATRGAGVRGLAGILPVLASPPVIRPLLDVPRSAILLYAARHGIAFREDSTNRDLRLRRNLVRHRLMSAASGEVGTDLRETLARLARAARGLRKATSSMIDTLEHKTLIQRPGTLALSEGGLEILPEGLRNELIVRFLGRGGIEPSRMLVDSVHRLFGSSTGRWIKAGTKGQRIYRERDSLVLVKRPAGPVRRTVVRPGTSVAIGDGRLRISSPRPIPRSLRTAPDVAWVDAAALSGRLELRGWRPADRITPFGMASRKKVSDLLTDQKVPAHRKKGIPVLTSGGKIVWVCGVRIDDMYKVTAHTKHVLQFRYHISV